MTSAAAEKKTCPVTPFTIEIDHHRNCDVLFQCLNGQKLRSRITYSRTVYDKRMQEHLVPESQTILGKFPEIPGQRLSVDPAECTYEISDPLNKDPELCRKIKRSMENHVGIRSGGELRGVPTSTGKLDKHYMKTLVREIYNMVQANEVRVVKGALPSMDKIEQMDGEFLLNPLSQVQNAMPRFEKDYPAFIESLNRVGS